MSAKDDVLLAISQQLDEVFLAIAILQPHPHSAERHIAAVHEQPFRRLAHADRSGAKHAKRQLLDTQRESIVRRVDIQTGKTSCPETDVGSVSLPALDI